MIKRTVVITNPCIVRLRQDQLVLEHKGNELGRVPCEDVGVLILEDTQVTVTRGALARCVEFNVVVLLCDARHMPVAMLQPIHANSMHARILRKQIDVSGTVHGRLWKQIVAYKIRHQAMVVDRKQGDARHLFQLAKRVKSGDKGNLEAQAAKVYWQQLFGEGFRRHSEGDGVNSLLNYGYAILRAAVARAICAAGLHPALGIHHSNQYNAFALADDLLEPLRPMADELVYEIASAMPREPVELTKDVKFQLLGLAARECVIGDRQAPLMVALSSYVASFRSVLFGEGRNLFVPTP